MPEEKKNQFHPDTIQKAEEDRKARELTIKDRINKALKLGQKCLTNPDFAKYRENYENLEKLMVSSWIDCEEPDPFKYTVKVRGMALKLHQLRLLLHGVQDDAKKKG